MAEFKRVAISDIHVPERLRAVEEEHALAIAQSIVEHGLINPITVRATPASKGGKFTLVAGAHRLRATELNDEREIEAMVVEADKTEGQLIEITENLFRNELSVIDRAAFVAGYREIWEQKHGKISRGGDHKSGSNRQDEGLLGDCLVDRISEEAAKGFGQHVAERMGVSVSAFERLDRIARSLHPDVRAAARGTALADNQALLLKLTRIGPEKQAGVAVALRSGADIKTALAAVEPAKPKVSAQERIFGLLVDNWSRANKATKARFLEHIGIADFESEGA